MSVQTQHPHRPYRPASDPDVRRAKRRARDAWMAVTDARIAGANRAEIAHLTAAAQAASDAWYQVRGVANPHGREAGAA